ncbi:MAG: glycosyltransferase [Planctomycetota bacterium]
MLVIQHAAAERFRTVQYYAELARRGISCLEAPRGNPEKLRSAARSADVLWMARVLPSPFGLLGLMAANARLVFDFDDALHLRSSRHGGKASASKLFRFKLTLEAARRVAAGNAFLASEAGRMADPAKISVIPTVVNRDWYAPRPVRGSGVFTLGWIGSRSTLRYLESLRGVLESFHALGRPWRLVVVSDAFPEWTHLPVERRPWSLANEARDLADFDVGLNPLDNDDWCRGKCALKAVQSMAAGSAVLGSPVGVNLELIETGATGFLPATKEEWVTSLARLSADPEGVTRMGRMARERILQTHTMEARVDAVERLLREAAE